MDFTTDLHAFQGLLLAANNVHSFSQLSAKGGNEEKIKYVTDKILNFFNDNKFIENGEVSKIRKFTMFIVLNADLPSLDEMVELDGISSIIRAVSTIPKCLMCEMFWNLKVDKFVYQIICYGSPQLSIDVTEAILDNFKYYSPLECLDRLRNLILSCYIAICRLNYVTYNQEELSHKLITFTNNFHKGLNFFIEPSNSYKLNSLIEDDLYKYKGKCLQAALLLLYECLEIFTEKHEYKPLECDDVYLLTYQDDIIVKDIQNNYRMCDSPNKTIVECLINCNNMILDMVKALVMDINVDIFCAWSEFIEDNTSMQQTIGEFCYKLRSKLLTISNLDEHPLVNMMEQITIKPRDIKDLVNTSEVHFIIENIQNCNADKITWLHALLDKDNLCLSVELLEVIESNLNCFDEEYCNKLYKIFESHLKSNNQDENKDHIEVSLVKVFHHCNISDKSKIIAERFADKIFVNMKETAEFHQMKTEIFNKLINSPDSDLHDILTLFLQNPQEVFAKIFELASANIQQKEIMLRIMNLLKQYSEHYYAIDTEACLIKIAQKFDLHMFSQAVQNNYIQFLCGLKNNNIISETKLLLLIVMPNMHKALLNEEITILNISVKLLSDGFSLEFLTQYKAPMLAMIGQVLDSVRWKIQTFKPLAPNILQISLKLQGALINTYNQNVPENESQWLKSKLSNLQPLNMYYYRLLWKPPGNNYFEIITNKQINEGTNVKDLTTWLSQILVLCIQQEWYEIWDSLTFFNCVIVLKLFNNALTSITVAEKTRRTHTTRACLLYSYRNFVSTIRYKFFKEPISDDQVTAVLETVSKIALLFQDDNSGEFKSLLLPLFAYLTDKKKDYTIDVNAYLNERFMSNTENFNVKILPI